MVDKTNEQTEAAPTPAAPKFIGGGPRSKVVPLEHPVAYDGREYHAITLVRLNAKEVEDMLDKINRGEGTEIPIFRDVEGAVIPKIVLDALDDNDALALDEAAPEFIPRRFKPKQTSVASAEGAPLDPSSSA
jgi:hypothetical protein